MVEYRRKYKTYIDRDFGTRAIQNSKTGKLEGREHVKGLGDRTAVIRVTSPKDSRGWILGRTAPIPIKASNTSRGHLRRSL